MQMREALSAAFFSDVNQRAYGLIPIAKRRPARRRQICNMEKVPDRILATQKAKAKLAAAGEKPAPTNKLAVNKTAKPKEAEAAKKAEFVEIQNKAPPLRACALEFK